MSSHPILVTAADHEREELVELMEDVGVHHLPVIENGVLIGVWAQTPDGGVVMLGRDRVAETQADADVDEAMRALMRDAEVVVVRDAGGAAGVITRTDVLGIARIALGMGVGRRHPRPTVVRVAGAAGAGKTTLIMRSLARLGRFDAVVIEANQATPGAAAQGVREVVDPSAHWRAGLTRLVGRLSDSELIVVEDRDGEPELARGIGEDLQVAVVPVTGAGGLTAERLADAQAVVLTHADEVSAFAAQDAVAELRLRCPGVEVFCVSAAEADRGLEAWVRWLGGQVMRRRG